MSPLPRSPRKIVASHMFDFDMNTSGRYLNRVTAYRQNLDMSSYEQYLDGSSELRVTPKTR